MRDEIYQRTVAGLRQVLDPGLTFETFVAGRSNEHAHAVAVAVADVPGGLHNPLWLHGGSGLGKTHLAQAIGHRVASRAGAERVHACTAENFFASLVRALQSRSIEAFRAHVSTTLDLVILDDVDFLRGRHRTVQELCQVFEAMAASGKQLVLCSSAPPQTIGELKSRFGRGSLARGSLVEVHPLDVPHMLRVLERKARASGLDLHPDVARHIAGHVGNARELEGVLTRLSALQDYYRKPIDMGFLDERMENLVSPTAAPE
ncbi:MAG: DnaA/Hda family protein [Pseudomonadota bacterium]|nr:DnaA/Hda family protein [Pseudomonadota bacterium]